MFCLYQIKFKFSLIEFRADLIKINLELKIMESFVVKYNRVAQLNSYSID